MFDYAITLHAESACVWASCDAVPEFSTQGADEAEALREAIDGLESALSLYVDQGQPVPLPLPAKPGQHLVRLPAVSAAKVALWNAMLAQGVAKAELARRLGVHRPQVDRLVDLCHGSKMEEVERALATLGWRLALAVEAA